MMRIVGRLILVPLGLLLGALAALAVLVTLGLERLTHAVHGQSLDPSSLDQLINLVRSLQAVAMAASVVPALALIVVGEVARIRSAIYYVLGGGAALAALPLLARTGSLGKDLSQIDLIWQVFATAGFAGGLVYWLVAGRGA